MVIIYYTEINLICIFAILIVFHRSKDKNVKDVEDKRILTWMIVADVILCFTDMLAGILRGQMFVGAYALIEIVNLIYFEAMACIAYLWLLYVIVKLNCIKINKQMILFLFSIPLLIFTIILVVNPFTEILFAVNGQNLYVRGSGIWIHWLVTWGYLVAAMLLIIRILFKTSDKIRRQEIFPLLFFFIAPVLASIIQMLFYGVSSSQVGISLSIILIIVNDQSNQILMDPLTGMNNRKGLYRFFTNHILFKPQMDITLIMLDLNNFKKINDNYGHLVGDKALIDASMSLREACQIFKDRYVLCRYGGDEFVIGVIGSCGEQIDQLIVTLEEVLKHYNKNDNEYKLEFSMGRSEGTCTSINDFEKLLDSADALMYENKQIFKDKLSA